MSMCGLYTEIVINHKGFGTITVREGTLKLFPSKPKASRRDTPGTDEPLLAAYMPVQDHQDVHPPQPIA